MTHEPLDPRRDLLVASLYGELSEKDEQELQRLLASDPELRAEWEELTAGRQFLAQLEDEDPVPSFVFLREEEPARAAGGAGWWDRLRGSLAGLGAKPAWGLAAAAMVVAVLALADFRVQTVDGGIAFRFGDAPERPAVMDPEGFGPTVGSDLAFDAGTGAAGGGMPEFRTVSDGAMPVTRADLEASEARMMRLMSAMVQDYGQYRDQEMQGMLQAMYMDVSNRQDQAYEDLRGRIETMGVGFMVERNQVDARFQQLMQSVREGDDALPPVVGTEEQKQ